VLAEVELCSARTAIEERDFPEALRRMRQAMGRVIDLTCELKKTTGGAACIKRPGGQ